MKKFFGIVFILVGVVGIPAAFTPSVPETIGCLIGLGLACGLLAYFLLRENRSEPSQQTK